MIPLAQRSRAELIRMLAGAVSIPIGTLKQIAREAIALEISLRDYSSRALESGLFGTAEIVKEFDRVINAEAVLEEEHTEEIEELEKEHTEEIEALKAEIAELKTTCPAEITL